MKDRDKHLNEDELAEFIIPMTKLFCKIFHERNEMLLTGDLVNISGSVVTSIIASCIQSSHPTDEPQFKEVLQMTIALLIGTLEGKVPYDHNGRII